METRKGPERIGPRNETVFRWLGRTAMSLASAFFEAFIPAPGKKKR